MSTYIGWHLTNQMGLLHDGRRPTKRWQPALTEGGQPLGRRRPQLCAPGMHAADTILAASCYRAWVHNTLLSRVELRGDIRRDFLTKAVARERRVLWAVKVGDAMAAYPGKTVRNCWLSNTPTPRNWGHFESWLLDYRAKWEAATKKEPHHAAR